MSRIILDFDAIVHNIRAVDAMVRAHGARWTLATNVLSGDRQALEILHRCGVASVADTRPRHVRTLRGISPDMETWYMRLPAVEAAADVVAHADVSLNSQLEVLQALDAEAARRGARHAVVLMVEIGELCEGVFPGELSDFYARALEFAHLDVQGLGANLASRPGAGPNLDQLNQLAMFRELLELKFATHLPIVSAGTSAVLPLLATGGVPDAINHFRVGEAVFLGTDLVHGGSMSGLRTDGAVLEVPVVEVKETTLFYRGLGGGSDSFTRMASRDYAPGERGYRAVVAIGQVDTDPDGLSPEAGGCAVVGAGSDLAIIDLGPDGSSVKVGDVMRFRPGYRALMRLLASPDVEKVYLGGAGGAAPVPPVLPAKGPDAGPRRIGG